MGIIEKGGTDLCRSDCGEVSAFQDSPIPLLSDAPLSTPAERRMQSAAFEEKLSKSSRARTRARSWLQEMRLFRLFTLHEPVQPHGSYFALDTRRFSRIPLYPGSY